MKNRLLYFVLTLFLSFSLAFGLLACGEDSKTTPVDPTTNVEENPTTNVENPTTNIEEEYYEIILPEVENGNISVMSTSVKKGESVELTVSPNSYYELEYLKANNVELTVTNNKATIENVTENQVITANFVPVDVVVSFVVDGVTIETKTVKYNSEYGTLPTPEGQEGKDFKGWYTKENGSGYKLDEMSVVNNGEAHSLYAYFTEQNVTVEINGIVSKLVHLPNGTSETATLDIVAVRETLNGPEELSVDIVSSDSSIVIVDGYQLSIADNANGYAVITIIINGLEYSNFTVYAVDYDGLGYIAVSNRAEFLAMNGNSKYVLVDDIVIDGLLAKADGNALISTLAADAVIDGNGHIVYNAKLAGGANKAWINHVLGTVRNIAFENLTTADTNPYSTGLFSFLKNGALLENIYVDAYIPVDGAYDQANKSGGVLVGTLEGGTIKNVILNVNTPRGMRLESYGAFAGVISTANAEVYNSYAIINHTYLREFGNEYKYGSWSSSVKDSSGIAYNSVSTLVEEVKLVNNVWNIASEGLMFGDQLVLEIEPALSVNIADSYILGKEDSNKKLDFFVLNYGEKTTNYTITSTSSSDDSIAYLDTNGCLVILKDGTVTLTMVINDSLEVTTEVTVKPDYYLIYTVEDLLTLIPQDPAFNYKLANDLDFEGKYLTGADATCLVENFSGVFDGNGYSIKNAVLPGGWAGHSLIGNLSGTFKNVSFINLIGSKVNTNTAIISDNKGYIENVYVDFVINSDGREYGFAGVIAGYAGIGTMKNCITNIRLAEELDIAPKFYGSIFGNASNWLGTVENCYAIVHDTGVIDIGIKEGATGIIDMFKGQGSAQYQTYTQLRSLANLNVYDSSIWSFDEDKIVFGHNVVYTLQPDDEYTYISNVDQFTNLIKNNPSGKYRLANDIDFNGKTITFTQNKIEFSGELDGNGHMILNAVMSQPNIFVKNSGTIHNIAFINLTGPTSGDQAGLVRENTGVIDNVFIDYVVRANGFIYEYAGVIAANASTGTISSSIVNLNLASGVANFPKFYGSIVGKVTDKSVITNTYAITNSNAVADIAYVEASAGAIDLLKDGSCNQYPVYSDITKSGEDYSTFNEYWEFTNAQIRFNKNIVVIDSTQDEYIYISTVEDWLTLIPANPNGKYKLANDIDFKGGWLTGEDHKILTSKFTGELNGQGYALMNAKMPGGWAGHAIFDYNEGYIHSIAFINIKANTLTTQNALININRGIIENVYVDYVLTTSTYESTYNGVIATFADNQLSPEQPSEIRNCIVNVKLGDEQKLPPAQGSIIGKAGGWTGYVKNCYAVINGSGITDVCYDTNGSVAATTCATSSQFETYQELKALADVSMYDSNIWKFNEETIEFYGRELTLGASGSGSETPVEYINISSVEEWLTLIPKNPSGNFKLTADLDFKGGFLTGKDSTWLADTFKGILDGQGHQIKNGLIPGGWNGHAIFNRNEGIIRNIAFINITAPTLTTQTALFNNNLGIISNLYVDYVLTTSTYTSDYNGVIITLANNPVSGSDIVSEVSNCITNVRLAEGATLPPNQGSIIGKAGGWYGFVKNCYSIANNTGIANVYHNEAAGGVADYAVGTSRQFDTYMDLKSGANLSMYDAEIWSFTDTTISFFGNVVYSVE